MQRVLVGKQTDSRSKMRNCHDLDKAADLLRVMPAPLSFTHKQRPSGSQLSTSRDTRPLSERHEALRTLSKLNPRPV
jgi:hypothetical protein